MGFFNKPGKAFKGFCKDPVGRISKDLGFTSRCSVPAHVQACATGFNANVTSGAVGGAAVGARALGGPGLAMGAAVGGISAGVGGCISNVQSFRGTCRAK